MLDLGYNVDLIREVYTSPLRSALMIDDKFPTYQELVTGRGTAPDESFDYEGATKLMAECRSRNLLCDIQNKVEEVPATQIEHLGKSDLVVLDYHLDPAAATDPEKAIQVLSRLAKSDHANLVVVYTLEPIDKALRTVAARFKGASDLGQAPQLGEAQEEFLQFWNPVPSEELLDAYIRGERNALLNPAKSSLVKDLTDAGISRTDALYFICEAFERYMRRVYLPKDAQPRTEEVRLEMSATDSGCKWVSFGNVFVAFVSKQDGPETVFPKLEEALLDWKPLPMQVMLAHVRNSFEAGGFVFEHQILSDPARLTGWFYHALTGDDPDLDQRLKQLWARLLEGLRAQLTRDVSAFGSRVLRHPIASLGDPKEDGWQARSLALAKQLAGAKASAADSTAVLHALNSFLCSEQYSGSHVKTGTICKVLETDGKVPDKEEWVLCSSPACEMVPRTPRGEGAWVHDLDPIMAVTVLRLSEQQYATPLKKAEEGKHIFLQISGEPPRSFEVLDAKGGHPRSEGIFVVNRGQTDAENMLDGYVVRRQVSETGATGVKTILVKLKAVGQLRPSYADRFLHQLGQHSSRIGVDFVNSI